MKIKIYPRFKKPMFYQIICCQFIFFSVLTVNAQSNSTEKFNYTIPKGQTLYTENTKIHKDLKPFKKEYVEISDLGKVKVIESGDFVLKEYQEDGSLKIDTLWFAISEMRIENGDTLKSSKKLELRKQNNFSIDAKLTFEADRIYIEQSDKQDNSFYSKLGKFKETVHPDDEGIYFKLEDNENFRFTQTTAKIGLMTIPFKVRQNNERIANPLSPEAGFNNLEFFIGVSATDYRYKGGTFKRRDFSIGPFVGPGVVKLDNQNSALLEDETKTVLGMNFGIAILGAIDRVNLGVAVGVETIENNEVEQWVFHKKLFFGFICGYSLNN